MRINGKTIERKDCEIIVFPRREGRIVIKAKPVLDYEDFNNLCPKPEPPSVMKPGGKVFRNIEDKKYNEELGEWASKRVLWQVLESLKATEGLEWDEIKLDDSDTWLKLPEELKAAGFSDIERNKIFETVFMASGLSEARIEEATKSFLAEMQETPEGESSPSTEQEDTLSGEPVKDSE